MVSSARNIRLDKDLKTYYCISMSIILTSFKRSKEILQILPDIDIYSVSRFQPAGYNYNTLEFLGAFNINGNKLTLKGSSIAQYKYSLFEYYVSNMNIIQLWLKTLDIDTDIMLCCWCPYSNNTKNQIKEFGTFVCHTGLIGKLINKYRPDIEILLDNDRHKLLINEYKPNKYKVI